MMPSSCRPHDHYGDLPTTSQTRNQRFIPFPYIVPLNTGADLAAGDRMDNIRHPVYGRNYAGNCGETTKIRDKENGVS